MCLHSSNERDCICFALHCFVIGHFTTFSSSEFAAKCTLILILRDTFSIRLAIFQITWQQQYDFNASLRSASHRTAPHSNSMHLNLFYLVHACLCVSCFVSDNFAYFALVHGGMLDRRFAKFVFHFGFGEHVIAGNAKFEFLSISIGGTNNYYLNCKLFTD